MRTAAKIPKSIEYIQLPSTPASKFPNMFGLKQTDWFSLTVSLPVRRFGHTNSTFERKLIISGFVWVFFRFFSHHYR